LTGQNPTSYHLVNIFTHIVNSYLIYVLTENYTSKKLLALMCGLFFVVHPLHVEAVTAIYGRPELLATLFLLIAWITYEKSTKNNFFYLISLISYVLSLLCKESGIVFIGILLLVRLCQENSWKDKIKPSKKILGYILATLPYLALRLHLTKALGIPKAGQFFRDEPFLTRLYTMSLGYIEYFRLLIWPSKLYTEYDYYLIAKTTTLEISVVLALGLIVLIIITGVWQLNHNKINAFAILFFFVTTSIVSNIFVSTGILIAERVLYLAVGSICLLLANLLYSIYAKGFTKVSLTIFVVLLISAGIRTHLRNFDFQNNLTLFSSIVKLIPNHPKANYGLGLYYEENKEFNKAEIYFKKALEESPYSALVYVIVGNFYNKQGKNALAMSMFQRALELDQANAEAHSFYGAGLLAQGNLCEAKKHLIKAVSLNKNLAKAHNNLGIVYAQLNFYSKSKEEFEIAISLDPEYFQAKDNLKILLEKGHSSYEPINCPD
jgi:Flp pilus assembly protein TadD